MIELIGALYGKWTAALDENTAHRVAHTVRTLEYSFAVGCILGAIRGARSSSLQFLAEHHHTPPRTRSAVLAYMRQRNGRVMWGAGREAVRLGSRLALVGAVFSLGRWTVNRVWGEVWWEEVAAGGMVGLLFATVERRQILSNLRRGMLLGTSFGLLLSTLRHYNKAD